MPMLKMADVHLILQRAGTADAFLPSKLTNILRIGGHAVVSADPGTYLYDLAERVPGIYDTVPPGDVGALAQAIGRARNRKREHGSNAIAMCYARENLTRASIVRTALNDLRKAIR